MNLYSFTESCATQGTLRLVGGQTSEEGRLEVCIGGLWGSVCDNYWSTHNARVVCRELGYGVDGQKTLSIIIIINNYY